MDVFYKITFQHSFNMDPLIERMHQTQYNFHTQTLITPKILLNSLLIINIST